MEDALLVRSITAHNLSADDEMTLPKPYYEEDGIVIYHGDCRDILPHLPKVDLVLTDPPYGTTSCEWDVAENILELWPLLYPISNSFVMTASQPFTTDLINSNRKMFKYCWVWNKKIHGNFLLAHYQPMKIHEDVVVFGGSPYFPQMKKGQLRLNGGGKSKLWDMEMPKRLNDEYYPQSIIEFPNTQRGEHPTEKPVDLFRYMALSYSMTDATILDPFMGSGTTLRAAKDLGRKAIGIEIEEKYCAIAVERLRQAVLPL
jgi:site-specific DNA-methyltransferase (adenine-specific)